MKKPKHTKGPWNATNTLLVPWGSEHAKACLIENVTEDKQLALAILEGPFEGDVLEDEGESNAHLIAAAPEMFEALELALSCLESLPAKCMADRYAIMKLKESLKKARGEA